MRKKGVKKIGMEDIQIMAKLQIKGVPVIEIAKLFGLHKTSVNRVTTRYWNDKMKDKFLRACCSTDSLFVRDNNFDIKRQCQSCGRISPLNYKAKDFNNPYSLPLLDYNIIHNQINLF